MPRKQPIRLQPITPGLDEATKPRTVQELASLFNAWAVSYYRDPDGNATGQADTVRRAMELLCDGLGDLHPDRITSIEVTKLQTALAESGTLSRKTVNSNMSTMKRAFRWAAQHRLCGAHVYSEWQVVPSLRRGRSAAHETDPIRPAMWEHVEMVLPYLPAELQLAIGLQWITGMRSGELTQMRKSDIDFEASPWRYKPRKHKSLHHGKMRLVPLGPACQKLLGTHLEKLRPEDYVFSPQRVVAARAAALRQTRKCDPNASKSRDARRRADPRCRAGERYTTSTYYRAIVRAAKRAGAPHWFPHMIRHSAATRLRAEVGLEAARVILGHSDVRTTSIYAEADTDAAMKVAGERL